MLVLRSSGDEETCISSPSGDSIRRLLLLAEKVAAGRGPHQAAHVLEKTAGGRTAVSRAPYRSSPPPGSNLPRRDARDGLAERPRRRLGRSGTATGCDDVHDHAGRIRMS